MIKIINKTKHKTLNSQAIVMNNLLDKSLGLLKYKIPQALIFKTRFGIHTLFLRYSIDVLILNKQNIVVKLEESLKPFRFWFWNPKYDLVIELPEKTIKQTGTKIGDLIQLAS